MPRLWFSLWSVKSYSAQLNLYIPEFGRVTAPQLSHMFQSFKLNRKMNRCLRQGFCSSWKYVFVCVLFFSSFYHIKTGQSDSGPPIFHPSLHRSSLQWTPFVLWGEIQSYTLCASLTEKSVNQPSDFSGSFRKILLPFNKQSGPPGWGQREAREVGRQKENRAERNTETKEEVDSFLTKFWRKKKQREKKNKSGV